MEFVFADFVIKKDAGVRHQDTACVQYPARPINHDVYDWPNRCSWITLPVEFDVDIESRIQALLSLTIPTTTVAVLAVQSDGSAEHWSMSPKWPKAVVIIESIESACLREQILLWSSQSEAVLRAMIESLVCNLHSLHRHGIAHGNIHSLTVRVHEGKLLLPPILIGQYCFDIHHDYCPPEHLLSSDHIPSTAGDIWSLACAMIEILSGQSLFCGVDPGQILHRQQSQLSVARHERYVTLINWRNGGQDHSHLAELLISMLSHEADERPSIAIVLDAMDMAFKSSKGCYVQVQPHIKTAKSPNPVVIGRTEAWWRDSPCLPPLSSSSRLSTEQRVPDSSKANMETMQIEIGWWYNNKLDAVSSQIVVCLQFGDQIFTSNPIAYPTKLLNISHHVSMNRDALISICKLHPLLIRLMGGEQSAAASNQRGWGLMAKTEVDLRPLLSGFPIIEGCYQLEPSISGQLSVHVRPTNSLDQRDNGSAVDHPTWNLFYSVLLSD